MMMDLQLAFDSLIWEKMKGIYYKVDEKDHNIKIIVYLYWDLLKRYP